MAKKIILYVLLLLSFTSFSQKKSSDVVQIPSPATRPLSANEQEIRRRVGEDSRTANSFREGKHEGLEGSPVALGIDINVFRSRFQSLQNFYISKSNLIDLLYNPQADPKNEISGFWVLFTENSNEIAIVRTKTVEIDGRKNVVKFSNDFDIINAKTSTSLSTSPLKRQTLKEIQRNFKGSTIKGYFIGRAILIENLADSEGVFKSDFTNLEINVRKNTQNQYALILSKNNSKIADNFLGVSYYSEIRPIGGSSTSRPCPTTCPE